MTSAVDPCTFNVGSVAYEWKEITSYRVLRKSKNSIPREW